MVWIKSSDSHLVVSLTKGWSQYCVQINYKILTNSRLSFHEFHLKILQKSEKLLLNSLWNSYLFQASYKLTMNSSWTFNKLLPNSLQIEHKLLTHFSQTLYGHSWVLVLQLFEWPICSEDPKSHKNDLKYKSFLNIHPCVIKLALHDNLLLGTCETSKSALKGPTIQISLSNFRRI
jgi:hypothetical protein